MAIQSKNPISRPHGTSAGTRPVAPIRLVHEVPSLMVSPRPVAG